MYIEGKLQTRKWQDKSGNDRYTTEIVASDMQMLGGRGGSTGFNSEPAKAPAQQAAVAGGGAAPAPEFDDDIPF